MATKRGLLPGTVSANPPSVAAQTRPSLDCVSDQIVEFGSPSREVYTRSIEERPNKHNPLRVPAHIRPSRSRSSASTLGSDRFSRVTSHSTSPPTRRTQSPLRRPIHRLPSPSSISVFTLAPAYPAGV